MNEEIIEIVVTIFTPDGDKRSGFVFINGAILDSQTRLRSGAMCLEAVIEARRRAKEAMAAHSSRSYLNS